VSDLVIRPARASDLAALTDLYNHYVRETPATFDIEPWSVAARRSWLEGFGTDGPHRLLLAERAGRLQGYACSHAFRGKAAYDTTVETTVYLEPGSTGAGIATRLYARLFGELAGEDVHRALAGITLPNPASVALHARFGFELVGVFREVGRKFGRYWDVQWFEKELRAES
jgi:phosphinothricin acetyltransferase